MEQHDATRTCERCGAPVDDSQMGSLCPLCAIESAETAVQARHQAHELHENKQAAERPRRRIPTPLLLLVAVVCVGVIVWQAPTFVAAIQTEPRYREGARTTAGECDVCTENLWMYSRAIGFSEPLPALTCPATGEAYVVTGSLADGDLEVHCPNPGEHELSNLWIGSAQLVPEARP